MRTTARKLLYWIAIYVASVVALVPCGSQAQDLKNLNLMPMGGQRVSQVNVRLPGKFEQWPVDCWSNSPQVQWQPTDDPGVVSATIAGDADLGVHFVRFTNASAASPLLRFVVGEQSEVEEIEPNDSYRAPQALTTTNLSINGVLQKSRDIDHYAAVLKAGEQWCVSVEAHRNLKSPMDACLQLLDVRGNVLAQNLDRFGLDPGLEWTCPRDGTYLVRIFAFPETPDSTIGYAGGDNFRYRLHSHTGTQLDWERPFIEHAQALVEPSDRASPSSVDMGSSISNTYAWHGVLETAGDEDAVHWKTTGPGHWRVRCLGAELGSAIDPVLEILDGQGKSLATQGGSGAIQTPVIFQSLLEPGSYRVAIRDLHGRGSPDMRYRIEIESTQPEVIATVASDVISGVVGQPIEVEISLDRLLNCADSATLTAVGLPEGYACEPVASRSEDDSAKKIVLKIIPNGPCSCAWRISVQRSGAESTSFVTAINTALPDLWLVVRPAP